MCSIRSTNTVKRGLTNDTKLTRSTLLTFLILLLLSLTQALSPTQIPKRNQKHNPNPL